MNVLQGFIRFLWLIITFQPCIASVKREKDIAKCGLLSTKIILLYSSFDSAVVSGSKATPIKCSVSG